MKGWLALACAMGLWWVIWNPLRQALRFEDWIFTTFAAGSSSLILIIFMHYALQTWRNASPRDRCKTCGKRLQDDLDRTIICPCCFALPNQRQSPWAFWRVLTSFPRRTFLKLQMRINRNKIQAKRIQNLCTNCGYDLYGNRSDTCPECGRPT